MDQPLDLSITLTAPPQGSGPQVIASTSIQCDALGLSPIGGLLRDLLTQQERNDLLWYLEEYWKWPYLEFAIRGKQVEDLLIEVGQRLYNAVLGSAEAQALVQQWQQQPDAHYQISIMSDLPRVLSLPWESMHDGQGFLTLRSGNPISIVRGLPRHEQFPRTTSFDLPLRFLLVTARPRGAGFVDPRSIGRELLDELQGHIDSGTVELEFLRPPTLLSLQAHLSETSRPTHVLHFDGHGTFNEKDQQGILAFEDDEGGPDLVTAAELARTLHNSGIRLVLLTACHSATGATDDAFSSVAAQLLHGGIDAVVAMSASFLVSSATRYVEAFYRAVAASNPVAIAQERARYSLYNDPRRHLLRRRREEERTPVELHDWWVPQLYQQRAVILRATETRDINKQQLQMLPLRSLKGEMPAEPRYGFHGRARELFRIERLLLRRRLVVIHGFGGIGKTALVREAADWLTRTNMYKSACFISFEHGGDETLLLSSLGHLMNIFDSHYNPLDKTAALGRLKPILEERPALLIVDSLESILPGGNAPLETAERMRLWTLMLELANLGAGVLLTSRDSTLGNEDLALSHRVAYVPLSGLDPEDAYTLAISILNRLEIDRIHAPYLELRDLLAKLNYNPLAIQLVLPALRELPLPRIQDEFAALLPKFVDDTAVGRNRSLLASLNYSLQRLTEEQHRLLSRLAFFESGVGYINVLAITEISNVEWVKLRSALEQVALLTVEEVPIRKTEWARLCRKVAIPEIEQIHEGITTFWHIHPMLVPYLRAQPGSHDPALRDRYIRQYSLLAEALREEDDFAPKFTRMIVQRELPNLRHVLELQLKAGKLENAILLAMRLAMFLTYSGQLRERDELWRWVDEARIQAEDSQNGSTLTQVEWLFEFGFAEIELRSGEFHSAFKRLTALLARIETQPEATPLGRGSLKHSYVLSGLARSSYAMGQPAKAEEWARKALNVLDVLIKRQPDNEDYILEYGGDLIELGNALLAQGQYRQAQNALEESLRIALQQDNLQRQVLVLSQLGAIGMESKDYTAAKKNYTQARDVARDLGDLRTEALAWHNLGRIAREQQQWVEAEPCYRKSLAINELHGDDSEVSATYGELGLAAQGTHRFDEAEGWLKRALQIEERERFGGTWHAQVLNNLANVLLNAVRAGRVPAKRLAEARGYAEQSLAMSESRGATDTEEGIWHNFYNLAVIANLEGRTEAAQDYRRREQEAYASFIGNRHKIDQKAEELIAVIAAAATGGPQARIALETALRGTEHRHLAAAIQRILGGERDWDLLVEGLNSESALLILRVLETISLLKEIQKRTPEEIGSLLPEPVQIALERSNEVDANLAFESLSPIEQLIFQAADGALGLETLLQEIARIANGDSTLRSSVERALIAWERTGVHISEAAQRIWTGERDIAALSMGLNEQDATIVQRILSIIEQDTDAQLINELVQNLEPFLQLVASAKDVSAQRGDIEAYLTYLERQGLHIRKAIHYIWAGERDAIALIENLALSPLAAHLVLRLLAILAEHHDDPPIEYRKKAGKHEQHADKKKQQKWWRLRR